MDKRIEFLNDAENALFERKKEAALTFLLDRMLGLKYDGEVKDRVSIECNHSEYICGHIYYFDKGKPTGFFLITATVVKFPGDSSMTAKFGTHDSLMPELLKALSKIE